MTKDVCAELHVMAVFSELGDRCEHEPCVVDKGIQPIFLTW